MYFILIGREKKMLLRKSEGNENTFTVLYHIYA